MEGKEIKRYKNIEIPDGIKKLEYQDFKFDVPLSGAITFKVMFEPGVLPEVFPQTRERRTRKPMPQGTESQVPAVDEATEEAAQQEAQPADTLNGDAMRALAQALADAQVTGEPVADIAAAMADGEVIKAEIIGDEATDRVLVITAESVSTEATSQSESDPPIRKPGPKDRSRKGAAVTDGDK